VNIEGSTLWRLADATIPLGAGPERCVLATKSFTAKLVASANVAALGETLVAYCPKVDACPAAVETGS